MDQRKIGALLKELRKEKGITQEQMAEEQGVSGRTKRAIGKEYTDSQYPGSCSIHSSAVYYGIVEQTQAENTYPKFDSIPRPVLKVIVFIVIFAAAALIRLFIRP